MANMRGRQTLASWREGNLLYTIVRFDPAVLFGDHDLPTWYEWHCIHPDGYVQGRRITASEALQERNTHINDEDE